jgi:Flp pilus assembly protein TadG
MPRIVDTRRRRRRRGQALVEFALVFPIFMLVLAGILDFGFMLYSRMGIINAAREGARASIMVSDYTTVPTVAQGAVISSASTGGIHLTASNVTTTCIQTTSGTTPPPTCTWSSAKPGDSVRVTVSYSYQTFFPLFFGASFNLNSTVQMVLEG